MIKPGDKVFYVYNGNIKGIIREIIFVDSKSHLSTGPAAKERIAIIVVNNNGIISETRIPVRDLMIDN
jgi:hypothetical protein